MSLKLFWWVLLLLLHASCTSAVSEDIDGAGEIPTLAPTAALVAPKPTFTSAPVPTDTAEPTDTPLPSKTPSPTETPVPVDTFTPVATSTLIPTNTRAPTLTPGPTNTSRPTATIPPPPTATIPPPTPPPPTQPPAPASCNICSYDEYNCGDFSTHNQAQACFDYCWSIVGYDVHNLDRDGDGIACESLP
jgi:hypothetical protein